MLEIAQALSRPRHLAVSCFTAVKVVFSASIPDVPTPKLVSSRNLRQQHDPSWLPASGPQIYNSSGDVHFTTAPSILQMQAEGTEVVRKLQYEICSHACMLHMPYAALCTSHSAGVPGSSRC